MNKVFALSYEYIGGKSSMPCLFKSVEGAMAYVASYEGYGEGEFGVEWDYCPEEEAWIGAKSSHSTTRYYIREINIRD